MKQELDVLVAGGSGALGKLICAELHPPFRAFPIGRDKYDFRSEADTALAMLVVRPSMVVDAVCDLSDPASSFRTTLAAGMNLIHTSAAQQAQFVHLAPANAAPVYSWDTASALVAHYEAKEILGRMCRAYAERYVKFDFVEIHLPRLIGGGSDWLDPITVAGVCIQKALATGSKDVALPFHKDDVFDLLPAGEAARLIVAASTGEPLETADGKIETAGKRSFSILSSISIGAKVLADVVKAHLGFSGTVSFGKNRASLYRIQHQDLNVQLLRPHMAPPEASIQKSLEEFGFPVAAVEGGAAADTKPRTPVKVKGGA